MKGKIILKRYLPIICTGILFFLFLSIWFISTYSNTVTSNAWDGTISANFSGGNGSEENPYIIKNGSDLAYLKVLLEGDDASVYSKKNYILTSDINLGDREFSIKNIEPFSGTINGDAHFISNGVVNTSLFLNVEKTVIKNINFENMTVKNSLDEISALIASKSKESTFENITTTINYQISKDNYVGTFLGIDQDSKLKNVVINVNYEVDNSLVEKIGSILYEGKNTELKNILIKKQENIKYFVVNDKITESETFEFTIENNKFSIKEGDILKTLEKFLDSKDYYFEIDNNIILSKKEIITFSSQEKKSLQSFGLFGISALSFQAFDSGIVGNTVYVNDLDADWNYYYGLNYVSSDNGSLPNGNNQNLYNESNLVKVQISYSGVEEFENTILTGTVSLTETQNKYIYYKYYPVENGKVKIELIDNPFTNRPNNKGFNNWVVDGGEGIITFDSQVYKRYLETNVEYENGLPKDIVLSLHASWVDAVVVEKNSSTSTSSSTVGTWAYIFNSLKTKAMTQIEITEVIYDPFDMGSQTTQYYYRVILNRYDSLVGYYSASGVLQTSGTCNSSSCTYYQLILPGDYFVEGTTYYQRSGSTMATVNNNNLPRTYEVVVKDPYKNHTMAGYYIQKLIPRYDSIVGYYDSNGVLQTSGTCTTSSGCTYYQLIQSHDSNAIANISDNYYYMVTRDTNIIYLTANFTSSSTSTVWSSSQSQNKPFTFTGINNGTNYNATWTLTSYATAYNDITIENLRISCGTSTGLTEPGPTSSSTARYIYGNWKNVKIGRGLTQSGTYRNFYGIVGGTTSSPSTTASNPARYSLIIESGKFSVISLSTIYASSTTNYYLDMAGVYGNDYDRVANNNSNLDVYFVASGGFSGNVRASTVNDTGLNLTVKSGSFGTSKYDHTTGIYVGGRGYNNQYTQRAAKIEGGYIYNLIGGPLSASTRAGLNDTFIYVTGGEIDMIVGGAGTSATYGNRILSLTGGTVNYSVFGGSNGYNGASSDGTVNGSSLIYVGGNAQIGNPTYVNNNNVLYTYTSGNTTYNAGTEAGSIFGIGNGSTIANTIGSSDNSNIIIDGNAHILRNVYGGGNYGATGISATANTNTTNINIMGGTIDGDVYGGGNRNGAGSTTKISIVNINMTDGNIKGNIYGGANIIGVVYGTTNLNITSGKIDNNIYGGGKGGYASSSNSGTFIARDVNVTIGTESSSPTIEGNVYGGSAFGSVNGTTNTTNVSSYTTNVTVKNGVIIGSVFGGGEGNSTYTPYVMGNITVNINNGSIGYVYGGNDQAGTPNGTSPVYLNGGTIGEAYGGGNRSSVRNTEIYLNGSTVTHLFGGSNTSGNVTSSSVIVTNGTVENIYGGNNVGGNLTTANVRINGGNIINEVYGGGNLVSTVTANLYLNNSNNVIPNVYGGGKSASVTTANIEQNGVGINRLFGGSNISGVVLRSNLNYINGNVGSVYGGNNEGGQTTDSIITITNGTITNLYGGGLQAPTISSNITVNNGTITNLFGGGNEAGITDAIIRLNSGTFTNVYGGSNNSGTVTNSTITVSGANVLIDKLYGGNNAGGQTTNPKLIIQNGTIDTIYGGGNLAITTNTDISIANGNITTLFGGGNQASVSENTKVNLTGGNIIGNIYGGGNYGTVEGDTEVRIVNTIIKGSAHAGGNGISATVKGNTNIFVGGNTIVGDDNSIAPAQGSVFGGGNAATTGEQSTNNSVATVNIAGGSIYGNVYGGANTSVVYGTTDVNIGKNTFSDSTLSAGNIYIKGTIFGGGEANASGSEIYDYSFISVTNGIDIEINGNGHNNFITEGSIFGSGNASSSLGQSSILIKNSGTISNPQRNISIQRADVLTIDNSAIVLSGASDRTNEYSDVPFTLSRIESIKVVNNSTLYLETGANLLKKWESLQSNGEYAEVFIDEENETVSKNTDNRVYLLEGKNLNIATDQSITSYGEVHGMTFFGMYTYNGNGTVNTGIYNPSYDYGDTLDWGAMPAKGSYVLGLHNVNHDIENDGFYSNFMDEETSTNIVNYITPTPEDSNFYMWVIGEAVIEYTVDLVASKYATLGTAELTFLEFSDPNTTFQVVGFDSGGLNDGVSLVNGSTIPRVAETSEIANNVMGLSMKSSNNGWLTKGETKFLSSNPNMIGTTAYVGENSADIPSMLFYLYHSKNLTDSGSLGTVTITIMAITKIDALTSQTERLIINVNLSTAVYQTNEYEGTMTPGKEYSMFSSTVTNITSKSSLSAYYSLYAEGQRLYREGYHRALVSSYVLPLNTKITMIDFVNENPVYYYHVIDSTDVANAQQEYSMYGEASYNLSLFTKMGSINSSASYDDETMNNLYYSEDRQITEEEFIFIVDFGDTNISSNHLNNSLLIELRDDEEHTIISVLGIQHLSLMYNLYANNDAYIDVDAVIGDSSIYAGHQTNLNIDTNYVNSKVGANQIFDTSFFDSKLGIKISFLDNEGNTVSGTNLLGVSFLLDGVRYFPNLDGSTRIKIADRVGNVATWITLDMSNTTLDTGSYTIQIESFASPDGIYYGSTTSGMATIPITVINDIYGLDVNVKEYAVVLDGQTGLNQNKTNLIDYTIKYSSGLNNPNIRMSLYRRNYDNIYSTEYELVDLDEYTSSLLLTTNNQYEYLVIDSPQPINDLYIITTSDLKTGTYRLDFSLYDGSIYIGKVSRYIIIK